MLTAPLQVLVPVYLLLGHFSNTAAVALSNSTIAAASLSNVAVVFQKRHPLKDRPLVDFDLVLLMAPTTVSTVADEDAPRLGPGLSDQHPGTRPEACGQGGARSYT